MTDVDAGTFYRKTMPIIRQALQKRVDDAALLQPYTHLPEIPPLDTTSDKEQLDGILSTLGTLLIENMEKTKNNQSHVRLIATDYAPVLKHIAVIAPLIPEMQQDIRDTRTALQQAIDDTRADFQQVIANNTTSVLNEVDRLFSTVSDMQQAIEVDRKNNEARRWNSERRERGNTKIRPIVQTNGQVFEGFPRDVADFKSMAKDVQRITKFLSEYGITVTSGANSQDSEATEVDSDNIGGFISEALEEIAFFIGLKLHKIGPLNLGS